MSNNFLIRKSILRALFLSAILGSITVNVRAAQLVDDRAITITTSQQVEEKRRAIIQYLWGPEGFPKDRQPQVLTNISSPVKALANLDRVDEFRIDMAPGLEGLAYHFIPLHPNHELVVVHHGHACTLDDDPSAADSGYGLQRTINALLREGYGVLGVFMPRSRPGDCTGAHEAVCQMKTTGSPVKFFLEPTAISLNYLKNPPRTARIPNYRAFHITGLSGGGWTTTVYAAVDPAIRCSVSVAGTMPLYLRSGGSVGDIEQFEPSLYSLAGYPDLYLLGAHGDGRRQIQIVLRKDDCCFGEAQHDSAKTGLNYAAALRDYEQRVQSALKSAGPGAFRVEIDETAPSHMISHHVIEDVLLPELRKAR